MKANLKTKSLSGDDRAIWDMIIGAAFAVIFVVCALYIGTFIQATVGSSLISTIGTSTTMGIKMNSTLNNLSNYWDTDVGMLNIALVIVIITLPLMALVYVRKIM